MESLTVIYILLSIIGLIALLALLLSIVLPFIVSGQTGATGASGTDGSIGPTGPTAFSSITMGNSNTGSTGINQLSTWSNADFTVISFDTQLTGNSDLQQSGLFVPNDIGTWGINYNVIIRGINISSDVSYYIGAFSTINNDFSSSNLLTFNSHIPNFTNGIDNTYGGTLIFNVTSTDLNKYSYYIAVAISSGTPSSAILGFNTIINSQTVYLTNATFFQYSGS